jgi:hypothetical protein
MVKAKHLTYFLPVRAFASPKDAAETVALINQKIQTAKAQADIQIPAK